MTTLDLPTLQHLHTPISVALQSETKFEEVVQGLHPTPALGGTPAATAWRLLGDWNQEEPRYRFGAPFGARLDTGESVCLVEIRNIQWVNGEWLLGSGCGLVEDSELDREWDELFHKRQSVLKLLGLS